MTHPGETSPPAPPPAAFWRRYVAFEVPRWMRAWVRARESSLIFLGALIGAAAGLVVAAMSAMVSFLHEVLFRIPSGARLSGMEMLDPVRALAVPVVGGLLFGLVGLVLARWRPQREVDPIEANALHGGQMSLRGSFIVAAQTVWSSGVGASVGLEAGYTQLASGLASRIGRAFHLRRGDLRVMVGCGAAGAIGGAFGAPLAGAFYAFELVIGSYSIVSLGPVAIAALVGYFVTRMFGDNALGIEPLYTSHVTATDLLIAAGVGLFCAALGMLVMRSVAQCEALFSRLKIRQPWRPMIGGAIVGMLALLSPQVLSSGHGAIHIAGMIENPLRDIALVLLLKGVASTVSLGSGFRGGLFFASLLMGALAGRVFTDAVSTLFPALGLDPHVYAIIGMSALSVSVIGAPVTMTFIALETTGDLWLTAAVLVAVVVSGQITREVFGYSFATWRFHLRGETIRSAADIGWIRELTVRRMMRPDVKTVPAHTTIARFRMVYPLGSVAQVIALDDEKHYAGVVLVAEAHATEIDETKPVRDILRYRDTALLPTMTVKEAVAAFDKAEAEALVVVESREDRSVAGLLTESYTLKRYAAELELRRQEMLGEQRR